MPDLNFFDAAGFFAHKIAEVEQLLISKQTELEILYANRRNLDLSLQALSALSEEHQRALGSEAASLREVCHATDRSVHAMEGEIELLRQKLAALQAARDMLHSKKNP